MPDEGKEESIATEALRGRRDRPWPLIGLGLLAIGGAVLLSHATLWPHGDAWFGLLIVGGAILWLTRTRQGRPRARRRRALAAPEDSHRIRRFFGAVALTLGRSSRCSSSPRPSSRRSCTSTSGAASATARTRSRDTRIYVTPTSSGSATCASTCRTSSFPPGRPVSSHAWTSAASPSPCRATSRCRCTATRSSGSRPAREHERTATTRSGRSTRPAGACSCSMRTSARGSPRRARRTMSRNAAAALHDE